MIGANRCTVKPVFIPRTWLADIKTVGSAVRDLYQAY